MMSDGRRVQPAHWLLIGIAVVLVAVGVTIVVRRGDADPTVAVPTTAALSATPSVTATPRPDCAPQITASWGDSKLFAYGFVYRSTCDQVVRKLRFRIAA